MDMMVSGLAWMVVAGFAYVFLLGKCYFLAPYRIGWLMLIPNVVQETVERRLGLARAKQDFGLLLLVPLGLWGLAGSAVGLVGALVLGAAWAGALLVDLRWRSDFPARQLAALRGRVPLPVPRLIVSLRGPVLERMRDHYALGDWPRGTEQGFDLLVLNPGTVRPQLPLRVSVGTSCADLSVTMDERRPLSAPEPGQVLCCAFAIKAREVGSGGAVQVRVEHGDWSWERTLRIGSVPSPGSSRVRKAAITRWRFGSRAAFVWRGDHDLHDPSTFQSAEGLRIALGLAARFRMPTTVMLSARLSLVQEEHEAFCNQFGWDRRSGEIPDLARFLREEVDTSLEQEFPTRGERRLTAEIGNHCFLHYGTHAAAAPENGWLSHARMGQGRYPWLSEYPCDSFTEQRDNILKASEVIEAAIGVRPASFTIPSDVVDKDTARAVEAAGIQVGTETDATKFQKLLVFPPEHHPAGCGRLVELTRMLPRDPVNAAQVAMLKFWVGFARRNGRALVYLAHHHLVMYEGNACYNLTAELLRSVLADTEGDVYCGTLTAVGRYWRDVLSEQTRCVRVQVDGDAVSVENSGDRALRGLPVEIELAGGGRLMRLVDVPAGATLRVV
ncbi:hypothetical protein [Thiocapsa rosea]|nr:hypothetical protein [Thiocapsa rosea]